MHRIFIPSSGDEYLGCFRVLAVISHAAVRTGVRVTFHSTGSSGYMPRSQIAGSMAVLFLVP